jgi:hypothetical protein
VPRGFLVPYLKLDEIILIFAIIGTLAHYSILSLFKVEKVELFIIIMVLIGCTLPLIGQNIRGWPLDVFGAIAVFKPLFIYKLLIINIRSARQTRVALTLLITSSIIVSVLAILQFIDFPGVRLLLANIYFESYAPFFIDPNRNIANLSMTSTLGDKNTLGGYAALISIITVTFLLNRTFKVGFLSLLLAASLITLVLSGSSSSTISFLFAFLVLLIFTKKLKSGPAIAVVLLCACLAGLFGKEIIQLQLKRQFISNTITDRSTKEVKKTYGLPRTVIVRYYLAVFLGTRIIEDRYAIALGFGSGDKAEKMLPWGTTEIGYLKMFFHYGAVYMVIYILFYLYIIRFQKKCAKTFKPGQLGYTIFSALYAATVFMIFANLIFPYYSAAGSTHIFYILLGLFFGLLKRERICANLPNRPGILAFN